MTTLDFRAVETAQDFVNFAQSGFSLPTNPTPEQFKKAEPIMLQMIIEENYDTSAFQARENGEFEGGIIDPLDMKKVRQIRPGEYTGEFTDGDQRFRFTLSYKTMSNSKTRLADGFNAIADGMTGGKSNYSRDPESQRKVPVLEYSLI